MLRKLRESERFIYIEDLYCNTAILDKSSDEISDWCIGYEASCEKMHLLDCSDEEFNKYCSQACDPNRDDTPQRQHTFMNLL